MKRRVIFTAHAEEALRTRAIDRAWVLATLAAPDWSEVDASPGRTRAFRAIPEYGNRILRVVYEKTDSERIIVTLFFDRKAGRRP